MKPRRSARVFLFDDWVRLLLIHFRIPVAQGLFCFWLTPGGEIEPGESPGDAAVRELREELGLETVVTGPVYTERNQFEHEGEMRDNTDYFFVARCLPDIPHLCGKTPDEIAAMQEARWWTRTAIAEAIAAGERFFPVDILSRLDQLAQIC